ncbi:MAG: phosphoenolpyruvate--protein phosphotransferase [Phycisphaeraceae bacterium]|nr:phosphoenolpyruvate--protein phosphotransferase [Phycisphaeraceae bacterium]
MQTIKGIAVSPGIAIGEVFILDDQRRRIPRRSVGRTAVVHEHARLDAALNASISELSGVRERTRGELGEEAAKIFAFHLGMLADKSLTRPMHELIEKEQVNAEYAVFSTMTALAERFSAMGDQAFKTKVDDVYDLSARVLKHLIGEHASKLADLDRRAIVLARDLTPSQAAAFNKSHVLGFVTEAGGKTGHTGIFARAMQIPAIVGAHGVVESCTEGTPAIIDGDQGTLILDPDEKTLQRYRRYEEQQRLFRLSMSELAKLPCLTLDGAEIELLGNIEFPEEIPSVVGGGGQGVGLYRTEYLYFTGDAEPTEEDHFAAYSKCVEMLGGRPLTIRTMDLGADKYTQEQADNPERNPMLGCRSLRYCLQNQPMFKRQLRAILRASALGPVRLMFPLVTTPDEFKRARFILNDVMEDLRDEHAKFDPKIKVGMMVEVPSAAICAETFAQHADFFSIGTNDLVQYVMAVDRTNDRVAEMYNPANPAVTALIRGVAAAAKNRNIPVSCCGESAGELEYTMLLIGLGVRTLSVSAAYLPALKRLIRSVSIEQCERVAEKAASIESDVAVSRYLRDVTRKIIPEAFDGRAVED